jgi:capsular polysaccharide biosynthesis protein
LQLVDVITSLRRHWRVSLGLILLVAIALGAFMVNRNESLPPDRWEAAVHVLVPARSEDGELPEGVPAQLLQGQEGLALSDGTTDFALEGASLDEAARDDGDVEFEFTSNERGDIHVLEVTARTRDEAQTLAGTFSQAYFAARQHIVTSAARQARDSARIGAERVGQRLDELDAELETLAPGLVSSLPERDDSSSSPATTGEDEEATVDHIDLPDSTPLDVELLVYERQALLRQFERLKSTYASSSTETLVPRSHATVIERTRPKDVTPEPASPLLPIGVGVGLAVLLAVAVPVLLDRVDHSIRDARAASEALSAPILSTIPATPSSQQATLATAGTVRSQAYQTLAAASVATDQLPRAIVVTAPVGTTQDTVAANFAAALADLGLRVALVGTSSRQSWFGSPEDGGPTLPDFLSVAGSGRLNGQVRDHLVTTGIPNLRVLPAGDAEAEVLVDGLPPLLRSLADAGVDVTVIAGPSILEDPSATIMAWSTRSVLWAIETGAVTAQQASEAASRLELAGASPFGVAVVQRNA